MGCVGVSSVWATSVAVWGRGGLRLARVRLAGELHAIIASYLVGLVCSRGGDLALLARSKLGKVAVVVSLPVGGRQFAF